jgi:formate hydrogenlyase subunit 6/NADH:ubiquinone oxidoreductase subunit I
MFSILRRRLATGIATSRYPAVADSPPPAFRGMPELIDTACRGDAACSVVCPTAAIRVAEGQTGWTWRLDRAACIGCGLCIEACPFAALAVSQGFELASRTRADLVETVHFNAPAGRHATDAWL